jgi:Tn3 transposase DDE domain
LLFTSTVKVRIVVFCTPATGTPVTNAVIIWNTVYMQAALDQLCAEGYPVHEADLTSLSPARFEHLNPFGKYYFPIDQARNREGLRALRAA